jgi:transcriptional regulator with XRE-family HTH domain
MAREWSQPELGRRAGIGKQAVNDIERGRVRNPQIPTLRGIAKAFEIELAALLGETEPAAEEVAQ